MRIGSRVAILNQGRVVQVGTPSQLLMRPADAYVASFVGDVNRARAWRVADALAPWPAHVPMPALAEAVDETATLEQTMVQLIARQGPLAVRRGEAIVGTVAMQTVRELLAPPT